MNKVVLVGHVGGDADIRQTSGGTAVASFSLATNERKKGENGVWVDHTEWHRIVAFGATATFLGKVAKKGRQLALEGRIQTRSYTDREGVDRTITEVVAMSVEPAGGGGGSSAPDRPAAVKTGIDEDIPF